MLQKKYLLKDDLFKSVVVICEQSNEIIQGNDFNKKIVHFTQRPLLI